MVGGTGLVFTGVSPKLHVQLYAVIAGAARLGADQFPVPHDELLAALHDLGIHERNGEIAAKAVGFRSRADLESLLGL